MADVQLEMGAWADKDKDRDKQKERGKAGRAAASNQHQHQHKTLLQQAKDKLVRSLPPFNSIDVNDLKGRGLALWLAAAHIGLYLAVGLYLLSTGTTREYDRKFLSVTQDAGSVCEKIPVAVTGVYLADRSGAWSTNNAYDTGWPLYELSFTGTKVTEEQYSSMMRNFTGQLQALGEKTEGLDFVGSQIAWSFFRVADAKTKMELETTAELGQIFASFDSRFGTPVFSSAEGVCRNPLLNPPTFDSATLVLTATVPDHAPPSSSPSLQSSQEPPSSGLSAAPTPPPTLTPPPTFRSVEFCPGQISVTDGCFGLKVNPTHSLEIDLVSSAIAYALNFGIINTSSLTKTYSRVAYDAGIGVGNVLQESWVDDSYSNMQPVVCYTKLLGAGLYPRVCFATYGGTPVYPVYATIDVTTGQACTCPASAKNSNCNSAISFQLSLVFAKGGSDASAIRAGWVLQRMMQQGSGPGGPNVVKTLVSGLGRTAWILRTSDKYDAWKQGKLAVPRAMPYSQFLAGFQTLGPDISILSFYMFYAGSSAKLNAQGVTIKSLASNYFNVSDFNGGNYSITQVTCTDTIYQPLVLQQMALAPPVGVV